LIRAMGRSIGLVLAADEAEPVAIPAGLLHVDE
jgi:hypothetical protein